MNENEILYGKVIAKLNQAGLGPTDPAIKAVLDKLSTEKDPQKLKKILEDLLALDINELKDKLDKKRRRIEEKSKPKAKGEQEQELFILTVNGDGERLVDREEQIQSLQDRQRAIAERSLRVLEAMEKAVDAVQKGEKIPEMDLSYLKDLTPREFKQQMRVFKDFGLDPIIIGEDGQIRENPEREVTIETITKEDLEEGSVAFGISFEKMQTKEWREMAKMAKESCRKQGIESEYEPEYEVEIGDSAIEITPESNSDKIVEDDEMSL